MRSDSSCLSVLRRGAWRAWLLVLLAGFFCLPASAYPDRPVRFIVPYAAGGPTDQLARLFAKRLEKHLGQPVVPENRPGAASIVGVQTTVQNGASGYTVLFAGPGALVLNPMLRKDLAYDPDRDLTAVGLVSNMPLVMVVNPSLRVNSVADFVAHARQQGDKLNYGSPGVGTPLHLAAEMFNMSAGTSMRHVPFNGTAPALTSLMAGDIGVVFDVVSSAKPFIESGRLKALAVTTTRKSPVLPSLPTLVDSGFKDFDASSWFALTTAAAAPPEVKQRLNLATREILADAQFRGELEQLGLIPYDPMDPAQVQAFIADEKRRWSKVIQANKISADSGK
jgi:tripartite-type tricarboxylate transporter receptor subunit TctC